MINRKLTILSLLIIAALFPSPVRAQSGTISAGAGAMFVQPVGTLGDRFRATAGLSVYAGQQEDADWTWLGRFDYAELSDVNRDKMVKRVTRQEIGGSAVTTYPLPTLSMSLTMTGLSAVGRYTLLRESFVESHLQFGFGFTNWKFVRSAYRDSMFADSSGTRIKVLDLAVPANTQSDWSGTVSAGFSTDIRLIEPVWLDLGVDYSLIIGELWQALALDMENVSGLQSFVFRGGLHVYF